MSILACPNTFIKKMLAMRNVLFIVFFIAISSASYSQNDTTKWKYIDSSVKGDMWYHYYKPMSNENGQIKIWTKIITNNYEVEGKNYKNAYSIMLLIEDCNKQLVKILANTIYDADGTVLQTNDFENSKFDLIFPDSMSETLANRICKTFNH